MDISTLLSITPAKTATAGNSSGARNAPADSPADFDSTLRSTLSAAIESNPAMPAGQSPLTSFTHINGLSAQSRNALENTNENIDPALETELSNTMGIPGALLPAQTVDPSKLSAVAEGNHSIFNAASTIATQVSLQRSNFGSGVTGNGDLSFPSSSEASVIQGGESSWLRNGEASLLRTGDTTLTHEGDAPVDNHAVSSARFRVSRDQGLSPTSSVNALNGQDAAISTGNLTADNSPSANMSAITSATAASTGTNSTPAGTVTTPALQSTPGSPAWGEEFSQHMLGMTQRGEKQVDLHLHPRELGSLSVSLSLDDQGARAQFVSPHATVRSAVEQALPQLREALAQQGITLGETSVGEQRHPSSGQEQGPRYAAGPASSDEVDVAVEPAPSSTTASLPLQRGVDLYA